MPEYRRIKVAGGTYFFTVNSHNRRPLSTSEIVRQGLRDAIIKTRKTLPFKIDAWVLLPDHLHAIWTLPPEDANFAARWAMIKQYTSKSCRHLFDNNEKVGDSRRTRKEMNLWQRRFWEHLIRDDDDYEKHFDYIHWNPAKHGYVTRVIDWPYSTFHRYVAKEIYPPDWGGCNTEVFKDLKFGE
ncbi:MAG: transposase [Deltaproteobacteria bacterium]|nr:transposase [Deltaproteobacteria bacterium]MBI4796048.1 transposase [Deltaproteobacteria bacterium]